MDEELRNPATLTADELANPQRAPVLPEPQRGRSTASYLAGLEPVVESGTQALVRAETQEAEQRDDLLGNLLNTDQQSSQDVFQSTFDQQAQQTGFDSGQNLTEQLRASNLNLARLRGRFRTAGQAISGAEGQSQAFEGVQLNELSRQEAVEVGNAALENLALQGNYDMATQVARDTANFANQDRQAELNTLLAQYDAISGIVEGQEAQLLEQRKQEVEAEKAALERTQAAVDAAIMSGAATVSEMQQLTDLNTTDEQKRAIAQQIAARGAQEDRSLAVRESEANIAQSLASASASRRAADLAERRFALEKRLAEQKAQGEIDEQEAEQISSTDNALSTISLVQAVKNHPGLSAAVGPVSQFAPSVKTLTGETTGFDASFDQLVNSLTLENLDLMSGVLSETDIKILSGAATKLRRGLPEDEFNAELDKVESTLQRTVDENGITDEQAEFYFGVPTDDISEVESIYDTESTTDTAFNPDEFL